MAVDFVIAGLVTAISIGKAHCSDDRDGRVFEDGIADLGKVNRRSSPPETGETVGRAGNLRGSRAGQHSIRINDQWRVCFVWKDGVAERIEIVDYH